LLPDKKLFYKKISKSFLSQIIFLINKIIPIRLKNIIYNFITKVIFGHNYGFYMDKDAGTGNHVPHLKKILNFLEKDLKIICEYGSGLYSTSTIANKIYDLEQQNERSIKLISVESSMDWYNLVKKKLPDIKNLEYIYNGGDKISHWQNTTNKIKSILNENKPDLLFLDSSPWDSRTLALNEFQHKAKIIIVHDSCAHPYLGLWGTTESPIKYAPKNIFVYGELKRENLGKRNYSDKFKYWVEIFPKKPGHWTGPPTLIGSNIIDVRDIFLDIEDDKEHYAFFSK
jgi:hypothetical protein